VKNLTDKLTDC